MDPFLISIATAAAGEATKEAVKGVTAAVRLVKRRFAKEPENSVLLLDVEEGKAPVEDLAAAIERGCAADTGFREQLEGLAGHQLQISSVIQVNQAGQNVKFQDNYYGSGPKTSIRAETIENLRLD